MHYSVPWPFTQLFHFRRNRTINCRYYYYKLNCRFKLFLSVPFRRDGRQQAIQIEWSRVHSLVHCCGQDDCGWCPPIAIIHLVKFLFYFIIIVRRLLRWETKCQACFPDLKLYSSAAFDLNDTSRKTFFIHPFRNFYNSFWGSILESTLKPHHWD